MYDLKIFQRLGLSIFILALIIGCEKESRNFEFDTSNIMVNLAEQLPGKWDKACILMPYTTNNLAKEVIGFGYDVMAKTNISSFDGISLILTIQNNIVLDAYEIPQNNIDFSKLGATCYPYQNSKFTLPAEGWPYANHI